MFHFKVLLLKSNKSIHICHLTSVHNWTDIRIFEKMCVSLHKEGFEVSLIAPDASAGTQKGVSVYTVPKETGRFSRFTKTGKSVFKAAIKLDADIYHFHDPELLRFGKKLQKAGKKVVFDSHEDVPVDILDKAWIKPGFLRKWISKAYDRYEKSNTQKLSGVISVTEPITEKFQHPVKATIKNYPVVQHIASIQVSKREAFSVIYTGGLSPIRGIKELVQAIGKTKHPIKLVITGRWASESYRSQCEQLESWEDVDYLGFLSMEENYKTIASCHVGVVNLFPEGNNVNSLPVKTYEYMASGLVVQTSDFEYWKEEFGEYAFYHNPYDVNELAEKLDFLFENKKQLNDWAQAGQKFVLENRSWESQVPILIDFYNKILKQ